MKTEPTDVFHRRYALGGFAAAAAMMVMPRQLRIRAITQRGMAGGGLVELEGREAQFSLIASRTTLPEDESFVAGSVRWSDPAAGFTLASAQVTSYEIVEAEPERGMVRRIEGTMVVNDADAYPFVMTLIDAGLPGSGLDSVALVVGDGATMGQGATPVAGLGFTYAAAGAVVIGDLQDVEFEIPIDGADEAAASETPSS